MTGAFIRVTRDGKPQNIEVENLTREEIVDTFIQRRPEELVNWMVLLCENLRSAEKTLDGLVAEGILSKVPESEVGGEDVSQP